MKILILTKDGSGLGLAYRLKKEGHDITMFSKTISLEPYSSIYTISDNLWKSIKDCKFVIADTSGWRGIEKKLTHYNRPILGTSEALEIGDTDAYAQYQMFQKSDIPTLETVVFDDAGDIFSGLVSWDAKRTIIRYGDKKVCCDYRDWIPWSISRIPLGQKILFQKPSQGVSTVISGWFDGIKWCDSFSIAADLSRDIYNYSMVNPLSSDSRLVKETIYRLGPILKHLDYHGPVHLNLIVDKMHIYACDFHVGFLYPMCYTMLEFIKGEIGEFLHNIAFSGNLVPSVTKDYVGAVQGSCMGTDLEGAPILGLNPDREKHLVLHHISKDEDNYVLAKSNSCVLTSTAHGATMKDVADRIYMTLDNIKYPDRHFDSSLLSSVSRTFTKLKDWRYI